MCTHQKTSCWEGERKELLTPIQQNVNYQVPTAFDSLTLMYNKLDKVYNV